jgi:SOS-response transcriptional repressor LexA
VAYSTKAVTYFAAMNDHLRLAREDVGLSTQALADLVGTSRQQIEKLEKGTREFTKRWAERLAPYLNKKPVELLFPEVEHIPSEVVALLPGPPEGVLYGGIVEAGAFRAVDMLNQADERRLVPVPRLPQYPKARQLAFEVRGDSMNAARILEGMWAVAVYYLDYAEHYGDLRDGMKVVVEHTRADGAERELTIKELRLYRDRMELLPRSTNEAHKPVIVPLVKSPDTFEDIKIIAIVFHAGWTFDV